MENLYMLVSFIPAPTRIRSAVMAVLNIVLFLRQNMLLLGYDKNGKLVDSLYAKQQTAQSMLKILGYL